MTYYWINAYDWYTLFYPTMQLTSLSNTVHYHRSQCIFATLIYVRSSIKINHQCWLLITIVRSPAQSFLKVAAHRAKFVYYQDLNWSGSRHSLPLSKMLRIDENAGLVVRQRSNLIKNLFQKLYDQDYWKWKRLNHL